MTIERCTSAEHPGWLLLRQALWPEDSRAEHRAAMAMLLAAPARYAVFLASEAGATVCGFAEASLRVDFVNGTRSSPVAFLEGIYVAPNYRRQGVARRLVAAFAEWARTLGCREVASDALLDNPVSHAMHAALGFEETERVVYFRRTLP